MPEMDKGLKRRVTKDKTNMIRAITITTRRFGPSGSLKRANIERESNIEVIARIKS